MFTFNNNKNHLLTLLTVWLAAGLIIASLLAIALSALAAPAAAVGLGPQPAHAATTETFTFTGNQQTFTVPTGVTSVTIEAYGAQGGAGGFDGQAGGAGANGGYVTAAIAAVMPGETLYVYVGGQGGVGGGNGGVGGTAGFNGGAVGGSPGPGGGGGGGSGGASDVRQGGAALADRVVVGGGGAGGVGGVGGAGGATTGAAGVAGVGGAPGNGGGGGTPAAGGAGGTGGIGSDGAAGALGNGGAGGGGAGDEAGGGGGGGGYYGGGGGEQSGIGSSGGGGGGGSSYTDPAATGVTHTQGSRTGDGLVRITYTLAPEIDVQGNGQSIPNGSITPSTADDTDFGSVSVGGAPITHTFTISNSGNADLNLTGMPAVTLTTGAHFNVAAQPASPVISNTTTTFDVTFDPAAAGSFTDTVTIANDDADENPFTFVIAGTGTVAPTFAKSFVPDTIAEGGVSTLTFTIDNTASAQAAIALDFTDNLPAGVVVATPANAATTCGAR